MTSAHLIIDRLSAGAEDVLDLPSDEVIGRSLLELVSGVDVANLVKAAARCIDTDGWTSLPVSVHRRDERVRFRLVLIPMRPRPSLIFALVDMSDWRTFPPVGAGGREEYLTNPPNEPGAPGSSAGFAPNVPLLSGLSVRELEIVRRLYTGDRVPAIAGCLFLSQSTVRNHLSAVFRKLGVGSQQDLIHALRDAFTSSSVGSATQAANRLAGNGGGKSSRPPTWQSVVDALDEHAARGP